MKKKLPNISKTEFSKSFRESIQEHINAKSTGVPKRLSGYLSESEIYTEENYRKIRLLHKDFIDSRKSEINVCCATHNRAEFEKEFSIAMQETHNDWISARMLVHCCIQEYSLAGFSVFEWADDYMIDQLHTDSSINR